jgi:cytoskeletal protein RodZ
VKKDNNAETNKKEDVAEKKTSANEAVKITKVGAMLKEMRLQKGLKIAEISKHLCIRKHYIEAIEESDYKEIPAFPYGIGFIRSYANFLGLNGENIVDLYKEETQGDKTKDSKVLEPQKDAVMPEIRYLLISILAIILIYVVWMVFNSKEEAIVENIAEQNSVVLNEEAVVVEEFNVNNEVLVEDASGVISVENNNDENQIVVSGTASALVKAGESASITVELTKVAKIVTDAASLKEAIASGGTVYVANDITVAENLTINQDVTIRALDKDVTLNYTANSGSLFTVQKSAQKSATLTIGGGDYRLTVDGNGKTYTRSAPLIDIKSGTVHLYGTITNGISTITVGGIEVEGTSSTLNMYDGAIVSQCKCTDRWGIGGAIGVRSGGKMYMYGGTITGNTAQNASAVYVNYKSVFTMSGGTISGNSSDIAVNVSASTFKIGGGALISSDDKVSLKESDVIIISELSGPTPVATITLEPGATSESTVKTAGDGIVLANEVGKFTLSGCTIDSDGTLKEVQ